LSIIEINDHKSQRQNLLSMSLEKVFKEWKQNRVHAFKFFFEFWHLRESWALTVPTTSRTDAADRSARNFCFLIIECQPSQHFGNNIYKSLQKSFCSKVMHFLPQYLTSTVINITLSSQENHEEHPPSNLRPYEAEV